MHKPSWKVLSEVPLNYGKQINIKVKDLYTLTVTTWAMGCGTNIMDGVSRSLPNLPPEDWPSLRQFLSEAEGGGYAAKRFLVVLPENYVKSYKDLGCMPLLLKELKQLDKYKNHSHRSSPNILFMWDMEEVHET